MSLLVSVYKTRKKEWDNFSNCQKVWIYDLLNGKLGECPKLKLLGEFHSTEFAYVLANKLAEITGCAEYDMLIQFPKEKLKEIHDKATDNTFKNWCLAVLNTLNKKETLILKCD